ncbi:hypothetical protein EES46_28075 [Streptomyces sp. ADI98-10]|nr:hypothetical protein EES46_28075 [Streptomyces sp. ADI98-10]
MAPPHVSARSGEYAAELLVQGGENGQLRRALRIDVLRGTAAALDGAGDPGSNSLRCLSRGAGDYATLAPMDMGRESRWEKDALTVEIVFALVSGVLLALLVVGAVMLPALVWDLPQRVNSTLQVTGGVVALICAAWRMVRVLRRHDEYRRAGR